MIRSAALLLSAAMGIVPIVSNPMESETQSVAAAEYLLIPKTNDVQRGAGWRSRLEKQTGRRGKVLKNTPALTMILNPAEVAAARKDPDTGILQQNHTYTAYEQTQSISPDSDNWGLDRIDSRALILDGQYTYDDEPSPTDLYIVDSSVARGHPDFGTRAIQGWDGINTGCSSGQDLHGTHVAGIAGGTRFGVAKRSTIIGVRVLDCSGTGTTATIYDGLSWILSRPRIRPSAINLSIGSANPNPDSALDSVLVKLRDKGHLIVKSAGNIGSETTDQNPCTSWGASIPEVVVVGNSTRYDQRNSSSKTGLCVDLYAPGTDIRSANAANFSSPAVMTGTSQAAPFVTGAMLHYWARHPGLSAADVSSSVRNLATRNVILEPNGLRSPLLYVSHDGVSADTNVDVVNSASMRTWLSALANSPSRGATIGWLGDSVSEGQGLVPGGNVLTRRVIEGTQRALRINQGTPFCYPDPSIYRGSSTLIPGWYQSTPLIQSVELPKSGTVDIDWMRNSSVGPGGRAVNLQLRKVNGVLPARGTSVTFTGVFSSVAIDYYLSSWGRRLEVKLDGSVIRTVDTFRQLDAYSYSPGRIDVNASASPASHTITVTVLQDPRFYEGSAVVGGFTPYDADRGRCTKVLDLSHGGWGFHSFETYGKQTLRDALRVGGPGSNDALNGVTASRGLDLLVIQLGYNDPAYYTPSEFEGVVRRTIGLLRGQGYGNPILLVGMPVPSISSEWKSSDWRAYLKAFKNVASDSSLLTTYVGLDHAMDAYPNGTYWADTVHPNEAGVTKMVSLLTPVIEGSY